MKKVILSTTTLAFLLMVNVAGAQGVNVNVNTNANVNAGGAKASTTVVGNATSTKAKDNSGNATSSVSKSKSATSTSTTTAESHRSVVATFVKSLLSVANREGGIGAQVRVIAQAQNDSASTTEEAITKLETRSKLKTFLIGTDYKTVGELRAEISKTNANLMQLESLRDKAVTASARAELDIQIEALEKTQAELEAFVEAHEDAVSMFGWLAKLFN
jgi:hypothetical protein